MPTVKNLDAAYAHILKAVNAAWKPDVFPVVKETQMKHIQNKVYNAHSPTSYERRGSDGGMGDPENIVGEVDPATSTLTVTNETEPNGYASSWWNVTTNKNLPEVIEYGVGYDFTGFGGDYEKPRPFTQSTIDELQATGAHVKALKEGLRKQGIDTI